METTQERVECVECSFVYERYHNDTFSISDFRNKIGGLFTVKGKNVPTCKDNDYILYGKWIEDERYGRQFAMDYAEMIKPTSQQGFVSYMKSLKCGIGSIKARKIYERYRENVWDVIENDPRDLLSIKGISESHVKKLVKAIAESQVMKELMKLFKGGRILITTSMAAKLVEKFGGNTIEIVKHDTYRLCSVQGFGFLTVDRMAQIMGLSGRCGARIGEGMIYVLDSYAAQGNVCYPLVPFLNKVIQTLNRSGFTEKVSMQDVQSVLIDEISFGRIKYNAKHVYKQSRFECEFDASYHLYRLSNAYLTKTDVSKQIKAFEEKEGLQLAKCQEDAVKNVFQNPVTIITGGPGTGKSTIIKCILECHKEIMKGTSHPVLLAPTAKAARRMREISGCDATTIHSAVGYNGSEHIEGLDSKGIEGNLIIVDEMSMIDNFIFAALLSFVATGSRLVLVGDPDQLPSVGAGEVLYQILGSKSIPTTKLEVVFRQKGKNLIVDNAVRINSGDPSLVCGEKFDFVTAHSDLEVFEDMVKAYIGFVGTDGIESTILLCPMRQHTDRNPILSVETLNRAIQERINPKRVGVGEITFRNKTFREGDRVMQMKNTDEAKNGDTGYIRSIAIESDKDDVTQKSVVVRAIYEEGEVEYRGDQLMDLDLAYATTVHKSQGSEYKNVLIAVSPTHRILLTKRLLYTAVTRAKEYVVLFGDMGAYRDAVARSDGKRRDTLLGARIFKQFHN